ncbi:hypothetical protein HOD96_03425 [Candidatus Falkowbacteria bacterium]|jgi:hypothetical protein|nr:hypothetical protein [Candidatus Falkowbacteria bacterium]MBT4432979.1 hypothetical protein [Candidatus Falkowbacteria bacterium]
MRSEKNKKIIKNIIEPFLFLAGFLGGYLFARQLSCRGYKHFSVLSQEIGYIFVILGLLLYIYYLSKESKRNKEKLILQNLNLKKAKKSAEEDEKSVEKSKTDIENSLQQVEKSKEELEKMNEMMIGRELKMIELKKEIEKLKK